MSRYRLANTPLFPEWAGTIQNSSSSAQNDRFLPPEWSKDDTMDGLFGPLDSSNKNSLVARHREARLAFWRDLIVSQFKNNPTLTQCDPIISTTILKRLFKRKNLVPMGIPDIINYLLEHKIIVPLTSFLQSSNDSWWTKVVGYLFNSPKGTDELYVLLPVLQDRAEAIAEQVSSKPGVLSLEEFLAQNNGPSLELLLPLMPNIAVFEVKGVKGVKISTLKEPVSESDRALFHIGQSVLKLEEREARYAADIANTRKEVVGLLKIGNRAHATTLLRRTKMLEIYLEKASKSRDQLLRISASIEEAQTNAQVFEAMKLGAEALRAENSRIGGPEKVDSLMDTVSELIDDQEEISKAIGSTQSLTSADDASLEAELAELLSEDLNKKIAVPTQDIKPTDPRTDEMLEDLAKISIPTTTPSSSVATPSKEEKRHAVAM